MNGIFSYYTKHREHIDEYNKWNQELDKGRKSSDNLSVSNEKLKQKAKAIAEPLLLLDSYEHEKAEDAETFFQTYNIELMSLTTALIALPATITKALPFLNRHAGKSNLARKSAEIITKYKDKAFNIGKIKIGLPKIATAAASVLGGIFFARGISHSLQGQLGLIRKASFDATQKIINDPKMFAVLTPEQDKQVQKIVKDEEAQKSAFVERLKDKVSLSTTFQSVSDYKRNQSVYLNKKYEYMQKCRQQGQDNKVADESAKEDKIVLENMVKNVEHDVLEPLRKVETIANVTYSAMFTGGFLEYLISDKLVEVLGVKNKVLSAGMKFGVPLLTYLMLNKNISDIENKAILATKYKHLKKFTEHPEQYENPDRNKKQSPLEFIKTIRQDMKDYDKFAQTELPKIEKKLSAKKQIKLNPEQEKEAKQLQKNTSWVINNQREKLYEQSVGIKSLSETILGPLDIIATATGGFIGNKLSKNITNKKLAGIMTGLGAVVAFIPAAIIEAKLTKQQKLAEKISVMLSLKDMQKVSDFSSDDKYSYKYNKKPSNKYPVIFKDFIN